MLNLNLNSLTDGNHRGRVVNCCPLFGAGSTRYVATISVSVHVNIQARRRLDQCAPEDTEMSATRILHAFLSTRLSAYQ